MRRPVPDTKGPASSRKEDPMQFRVYQDNGGYWRWRLFAGNNRIVADSGEGYVHKQDCLYGISLVQGSGGAPVYE